jgi:hypothetical protein
VTFQVFILDGLTQVAEVTSFTLIECIERDLRVGNWRAVIPAADNLAVTTEIMQANMLAIEVRDTNTGWTYVGNPRQRRRLFSGGKLKTVELRGVDLMDELAGRLDWPDPLDAERWWITSVANLPLSSAVTNELHIQAGSLGLPYRQIPSLRIIDPPAVMGPAKYWRALGQPLTELWEPWFKGTGFTYRLALGRNALTGAGTVDFTIRARATSPTLVTAELSGDIEIVETAAEATLITGMAEQMEGQPENTRWAEQFLLATNISWKRRHREKFLNRPQMDINELGLALVDEMVLGEQKQIVTVQDFELPNYGAVGHQLGDFVQVVPESGLTVTLPIAASRLIGTPDGWRREVSVGEEVPVGPRILDDKISVMARRLRAMEQHA